MEATATLAARRGSCSVCHWRPLAIRRRADRPRLMLGGTPGCGGGASRCPEREGARPPGPHIYGRGRALRARPQGPSILAAINFVETDFGTDLGPSSAGAEGWMQFEPESWAEYGVDADGYGVKNPDDPWDAIFAAARLLRADGAPAEWSRRSGTITTPTGMWKRSYATRGASGRERPDRGSCAAAAGAPEQSRAWWPRPPGSAPCAPPVRLGRLARREPDAPRRPLRLLERGQPPTPGRGLPQPDHGHPRTVAGANRVRAAG